MRLHFFQHKDVQLNYKRRSLQKRSKIYVHMSPTFTLQAEVSWSPYVPAGSRPEHRASRYQALDDTETKKGKFH